MILKNNLIRAVIFLSFSIYSLFSFADQQQDRGWFFRVDTRPPEEIFLNGFVSLGDNDNVKDHSRGVSCFHSLRNSAFISVSTDSLYAASYARRVVASTGRPAYVYIIRSTLNFYRMSSTLRYYAYQAGIPNAETQSEWIAYRNIAPELILGVRRYIDENTPPVIFNSNYVYIRPQLNEQPYHQYRQQSEPGYLPLSSDSSVGACFLSSLFCSSPQTHSKGKMSGSYCESGEIMGFYSAAIVDND